MTEYETEPARRRRSLTDVLRIAVEARASEPEAFFGAAGPQMRAGTSETLSQLGDGSDRTGLEDILNPDILRNFERGKGFDRLFASEMGNRAVNAVGNEFLTFERTRLLAVEIMAEALAAQNHAALGLRFLVLAGEPELPPSLMILSKSVRNLSESRVVSGEIPLPPKQLYAAAQRLAGLNDTATHAALDVYLSGGVAGIAELFAIARPEIVYTRQPDMVPLAVPTPLLELSGVERSTAGILCRDADGTLGVTGALHGTGPTGSAVTVAGKASIVKASDAIHDIAFIPVADTPPPDCKITKLADQYGPPHNIPVEFDGLTTGPSRTVIQSQDPSLAIRRPKTQQRIQTKLSASPGDSGCALLLDNEVLAFAFENSAPGEDLEFTDWIWAANALHAMGLTPESTP